MRIVEFTVEKMVGETVQGTARFENGGTGILRLDATQFQVTDRYLAFQRGNIFVPAGGRAYKLASFGSGAIPPGQTGSAPDINRNPYNFVRFAGEKPWTDPAPERKDLPAGADGPVSRHFGHESWQPGLLHGVLRFRFAARTPLLVPESVPDAVEGTPRHFFRMRRSGENFDRYAIPGSSLKGVLRSLVEAASNDRLGVFSGEHFRKIPYRRLGYNMGRLGNKNPDGSRPVQPVNALRGDWNHPLRDEDRDPDRKMFLLNRQTATRAPAKTKPRAGAPDVLQPDVIQEYRDNLGHPHYHRHYEEAREAERENAPLLAEYRSLADKAGPKTAAGMDRLRELKAILKNVYRDPLPNPERYDDEVIAPLSRLDPDEEICYCKQSKASRSVRSFGKNTHYLWPAIHTVAELAGEFKPVALGLGSELGIAERMFGFAAKHSDSHHPFRGKIAVKTAWGTRAATKEEEMTWTEAPTPLPESGAGCGVKLDLAPLTSPATHAKSRPLYLKPRNGVSASYSDSNPDPELRGRKLYFKQQPPTTDVPLWQAHRKHSPHHDKVARQCRTLLLPLVGAAFECEIEFDNLTPAELGALLFVLEGDGKPDYSFQAGKGKPRGMGVCRLEGAPGKPALEIETFTARGRYGSLLSPAAPSNHSLADLDPYRKAFREWCLGKAFPAGEPGGGFEKLGHIEDFLALQRYPEGPSARYYPPNFEQYTWLPGPFTEPDEPAPGRRRSRAMGLAPECADPRSEEVTGDSGGTVSSNDDCGSPG
jgi:hypothetical protein